MRKKQEEGVWGGDGGEEGEEEEERQKVDKFGILRSTNGTFFDYRVMVVDLDLKSMTKLPKWIQLDHEIVDNYLRYNAMEK